MAASERWMPSDADGEHWSHMFVFLCDCLGGTYRKQEDPQKTPNKRVFFVRYVVLRHGKLPNEVCVLRPGGHVVAKMQAMRLEMHWDENLHGIGSSRFSCILTAHFPIDNAARLFGITTFE